MTGPIDFSTFVAHWRDIEGSEDQHYSGSDERQSFSASFCETHGLMRLGVHHERLPPGRRLSWPHAEADEEEFVFVLEGEPDLWADGHDGEISRLGHDEFLPDGRGQCPSKSAAVKPDHFPVVPGASISKTKLRQRQGFR